MCPVTIGGLIVGAAETAAVKAAAGLAAMSLAAGAVGTASSMKGQHDQDKLAKDDRGNALRAHNQQNLGLQVKQVGLDTQAGQERLAQNIKLESARSRALTASGEAGVQGEALSVVNDSFARAQAQYEWASAYNAQVSGQQFNQDVLGLRTQTQQRTNALAFTPDYISAPAGFAGQALMTAGKYFTGDRTTVDTKES